MKPWVIFLGLLLPSLSWGQLPIDEAPATGTDVQLVNSDSIANIYVDSHDAEVDRIAAGLLADDVKRVTGKKTSVLNDAAQLSSDTVLIGTIGQSKLIDELAKNGKIDLSGVKGNWESFVWQTVSNPLPNVHRALVIAGSDRRGTAYGVMELSRRIGVSPWYWWADAPVLKHNQLRVGGGRQVQNSPGVKYRGIFINDEEWGFQSWAKTFDPQLGNVGPKSYARLFELMLRLRLNYFWPAMHPGTTEFGAVPGNAETADRYAIVMGASHCEPMLRNNVYWPKTNGEWRYDTNGPTILKYWNESVQTRGNFEAVWTLGIRGIHDSGMSGPPEKSARVKMLEGIFKDQRNLIDGHVTDKFGPPAECFVPYKEVLPLYDDHLKVPDDVTLVWPDDNYGYIRHLPTPAERARAGGNGIYYHLSYRGGPMSYLWLETISPGLIWEELHKAWQNGADRLWILNVGDLKPAEVATDFYSQLAWGPDQWRPDAQDKFLRDFFTRTFGAEMSASLFDLQTAYYKLCSERKPETITIDWVNGLSPAEHANFNREYVALMKQETATAATIPADRADAYFEMVGYPTRMLSATGQLYLDLAADKEQSKRWMQYIHDETRRYNEQIAGGKWKAMMADTMVGQSWPTEVGGKGSLRSYAKGKQAPAPMEPVGVMVAAAVGIDPAQVAASPEVPGWHAVDGLGWSGKAVTTLPATMPVPGGAAVHPLTYTFELSTVATADAAIRLYFLPTMRLTPEGALRVTVAVDGAAPTELDVPGGTAKDENDPHRRDAVLTNRQILSVPLNGLAVGRHTVQVSAVDPGVVLDQVELPPGAVVGR